MAHRASSRWAKSCSGCAVVALAVWAAIWVFSARQLRQSGVLDRTVSVPGGDISLVRVPGGVARRLGTAGSMMVQDVTWSRDDRYLVYAAVPEMDMGKLMQTSMANSGNPFAIRQNQARMQREVMQAMAPRLHLYDLRSGQDQELRGDWPANLSPTGEALLSPDNRLIALELGEFSDPEQMGRPMERLELYVATLAPEGRLTDLKRLAAGSLVAWMADSRGLLYQDVKGAGKGTYLVKPDGAKPRRLTPELLAFSAQALSRDGRSVYARLSSGEPNALGGRFRITRLDLQTGQQHDIPLRDGPVRLGAIGPGEMLLTVNRSGRERSAPPPAESDRTPTRLDVGALDLQTGQTRWIRKGLVGVWEQDRRPLLDGRVIALVPNRRNEADTGSELLLLSALDGKVRRRAAPLLPDRPAEGRWLSRDGRQIVYSSRPVKLTGLNPMSLARETLWLADLNHPEDLLTGPGE
jgi:hypothetical protein